MDDQQSHPSRFATFVGQLGGKLGIAVCIMGFVAIFLGWNGAASFNDLRQQFPYLISGGITGLALVGLGAALLVIESSRAERAELQSSIEDLRRAIESIAAVSGSRPATSAEGGAATDLVVVGASSYHRPECRLVAGRDGMVMVPSDEADDQGLSACRICKPGARVAAG